MISEMLENLKSHQKKIQVLISISCLIVLVIIVDIREVIIMTQNIDYLWFLYAILLVIPNIIIRVIRWQKILEGSDNYYKISFLTKTYFIGQALNLILPGSLGDIGKSYYGKGYDGEFSVLIKSSIIDKLFGIFSLMLVGLVSSLIIKNFVILNIIIILLMTMVLIYYKSTFIISKIENIIKIKNSKKIISYLDVLKRDAKKVFLRALYYSFIGWALTILIYVFSSKTLFLDIDIFILIVLVPLIYIIRMIPISVAGLGTTDLFTVYILQSQYDKPEQLLFFSLLTNLLLVIIPGLIGILFITNYKKKE